MKNDSDKQVYLAKREIDSKTIAGSIRATTMSYYLKLRSEKSHEEAVESVIDIMNNIIDEYKKLGDITDESTG